MPIKGLTDNILPSFDRNLGKIRKGGPKTDKKKPGPDLDYFRFTSDRKDVVDAFTAAYDGKPTLINVYMPYRNAMPDGQDGEGCFSAWNEAWNQSNTLLHRCDGEYVVRYFDTETGKYIDPDPGTMKCPGGCTQTGRLSVIIPELIEAGFVGEIVFETHSKHDILSILGSLLKTEKERAGHPDGLMGVRFTLQRVNQIVSSPSWGNEAADKRHRVEKSLVKLTPSVTWVQAQLAMQQSRTLALEAPESPEQKVDYATGEIIDAEIVERAQEETQIETPSQENRDKTELDTAPFQSKSAAITWAMKQNVFDNGKHAANAYDKVEQEVNPQNATEMAAAWRADVTDRVYLKAARAYEIDGVSIAATLDNAGVSGLQDLLAAEQEKGEDANWMTIDRLNAVIDYELKKLEE